MITYREFHRVVDKYPPNRWTRLAYSYSSGKLSKLVSAMMMLMFSTGFIFTVAGLSKKVIGIATFIYIVILIILVLFLRVGKIMNTRRIYKIVEELGISVSEYNMLIDKYYGNEIWK